VAATNRLLEDEVAAGRFRDDLYYRLNVIPIYLPPLRERYGDVERLAVHFLKNYCEENRIQQLAIDPRAMEFLAAYHWPGNVRELENYIERAVVLASGPVVLPEHLPPQVRGGSPPRNIRPIPTSAASSPPTDETPTEFPDLLTTFVRQAMRAAEDAGRTDLYEYVVAGVESTLVEAVMRDCNRVQVKAAARLGINRNTLHKKLAEASGAPLDDSAKPHSD
jgi:DNA-binding NtrC family response regulator